MPLYLMPVVFNRHGARIPKYREAFLGEKSSVGMIDFGHEGSCLCHSPCGPRADAFVSAQSDVFRIPDNLDRNPSRYELAALYRWLESRSIPAHWLSVQLSWRQTIKGVTSIGLFLQRYIGVGGWSIGPVSGRGIGLDHPVRALPLDVRLLLYEAATSQSFDTIALAPSVPLRSMLAAMGRQWTDAIYINNIALVREHPLQLAAFVDYRCVCLLPIQDSFTDTDGTLLTAHNASWVAARTGSPSVSMVIQSNRLQGNAASIGNKFSWTGDGTWKNQYAQAIATAVETAPTLGYQGTCVRFSQPSTLNGCGYFSESANTDRELARADGTSYGLLLTDTGAFAANDLHKLEMVGGVFNYTINGTKIFLQTDNTYFIGFPGIDIYNNDATNTLDSWEAGNVVALATPQVNPNGGVSNRPAAFRPGLAR